jgi:competence protein ComEC
MLNPFYVWGDLGWYLSFLAFFGVLVIAPIVSSRLFKRRPQMLSMVLIETLSAEVMTLPLIMMSFGQLSLIALVANLLIVPLVPVAMLLSAIAAAAGAWVPQLAGWFAWPARILLTYMLDVVHMLANIPSVVVHSSISLQLMVGFYSIFLFVVVIMRKGRKLQPAKSL